MGRCKYYLSEQKDYEEYYEGDSLENIQSEYLVVRIDKSGKRDKGYIIAPYCDFQEVSKKRIKAPKGYYKRQKKLKRSFNYG